ncbi:DUF3108 domain-containing protein [Ideonella sp. BN130291]|uniref:DUF3108 domain-containing protein n=1 Tax=Ideonella sp. BN130291 TaxID=3112940 RepID=UPI002E261556|nr:DUF3108 domain-containing protein [Ideonella sp. BN130291]
MSVKAVKAPIVGRAAAPGWPGPALVRWLLLVLAVFLVHGLALLQWHPVAMPPPLRLQPPSLRAVQLVPAAVPLAPATDPAPAAEQAAPPPPPGRRAPAGRQAVAPSPATLAQPSAAEPAATPDATPAVGTDGAAAGNTEVPVYPTRLPPPLQWTYTVQRPTGSGSAQLRWQPEGERYEARLEASVAGAAAFDWRSSGVIDGAGIAPVRFVDRRRGRGAQAANFQREAAKITYSGPPVEQPLPAGAQDRLTWCLQLAGIVAAEPARWQPGRKLSVFVSGARGDAELWTFTVVGLETVVLSDQVTLAALKLVREPNRLYDTRAEVWLAPSQHYMPARLRLANGDSFTELTLATSP